MGQFSSKYLLWVVLIILGGINGCRGCFEEERKGLLEFKGILKSKSEYSDSDWLLLPSWVDDRKSDCCGWERVRCNSSTGRVMELSFDQIRQIQYHNEILFVGDELLNVSLFHPFQELLSLDLSGNRFKGCVDTQGFEKLTSLRKLEILNLGYNDLDKNILPSLGALTSLKTLHLTKTKLGGSSPFRDLANLTNLEILDLGACSYGAYDNGYLKIVQMQGFERLPALKKLKTLVLDSNGLNNSILPYLSTLTLLKNLSLSYNILSGCFPLQELATLENLQKLDLSWNLFNATQSVKDSKRISKLKMLETLDLSGNHLDKRILQSLSVLPSLRNLILRENPKLEGVSFPAKEVAILKDLVTLDLSFNYLSGSLNMQELANMSNLKILNLRGNQLNRILPIQEIAILKDLVTLDLSHNQLNGSLNMQEVASLKDLVTLDLSYNGLSGSLNMQELANMSNLKILNVRENQLSRIPPIQGHVASNNLEVLDLGNNNLIGSFPTSIWNLSSLQILSLANNQLNQTLPVEGFCKLKNLQELDLSFNTFDGMLPPCLSNLKSLRILDLSMNQFTGSVASALIRNLTSLEYIDLGYNSFELLMFSSFANHSKLEVVILSNNNDKFEVETENMNWVPKFQLRVLLLSHCSLNKPTSELPRFLSQQFKLNLLDLSHSGLKGEFPNWILENNQNLEHLFLRNNSLRGQFSLPSYTGRYVSTVDVSDNNLSGLFIANNGDVFPSLEYLNLSGNALGGHIPSSIGKMSSLRTLDLSNNNLSRQVPEQLLVGCTQLSILKLSNNRLEGQIFSTQFNMTELDALQLDNNEFTGTLSDGLSQCSFLSLLDISNNYMSGEIPRWMRSMASLTTLVMRNNSFHGQIPFELPSLQFLDLSHNSFTHSLPSLLPLEYAEHVYLQGNRIRGPIPKKFLDSSSLLTLDLGDNNLSGEIPGSIASLSNLRVLSLQGNNLAGRIPILLCQLNKINVMDLSHNSFYGPIPHCFNNISFGRPEVDEYVFVRDTPYGGTLPIDYTYGGSRIKESYLQPHYSTGIGMSGMEYVEQVQIEFITKRNLRTYKGDMILNSMSGLDLSCNNFTGDIPYQLGVLNWIRALNLSHNQLTGFIPKSFSNLSLLESLDLSYNDFRGEIPWELTELNFLAVFIVAYNNFSGRVPDTKQFGTFDESSYEGNSFLCGSQLKRKCDTLVESPYLPTASPLDESEGKWYDIDPIVFRASFAASYIMILLGFASLLCINPYWRARWFNFIEECIYSCCYFTFDVLHKLSICLYK